jgi:hypothetical protein
MNLVRSTAMIALLACGLALTTCRTLYGQGSSEPKSSTSANYVGSEVCQGGHEDQYKQFAASLHVLTLKNRQADLQGCEACHGPGAAHVDPGGDPEKILFFGDIRGSYPTAVQPLSRRQPGRGAYQGTVDLLHVPLRAPLPAEQVHPHRVRGTVVPEMPPPRHFASEGTSSLIIELRD